MSSRLLPILLGSVLFISELASPTRSNAQEMHDPTRPPAAAIATAPATPQESSPLDLSAIFFAEGRRVAIINGERVRERDTIGNAQIIAISQGTVRLSRDGRIVRLVLVEKDIKKMTTRMDEAKGQ